MVAAAVTAVALLQVAKCELYIIRKKKTEIRCDKFVKGKKIVKKKMKDNRLFVFVHILWCTP